MQQRKYQKPSNGLCLRRSDLTNLKCKKAFATKQNREILKAFVKVSMIYKEKGLFSGQNPDQFVTEQKQE